MSTLEADRYDIDDPDGVRLRFGLRTVDIAQNGTEVTMTMPIGAMLNPLTGTPTLAPLAVLVDTAASTALFGSRGIGWPVTTELALDYDPEYLSGSGNGGDRGSAIATVRADRVGSTASWGLARCEIEVGGRRCALATLTVAYIRPDDVDAGRPAEVLPDIATAPLDRLMAATPGPAVAGEPTLAQLPDPMLLNATGHIHGGVVACGLDLIADAIVNAGRAGQPFRTGSIQVNFLRPFIAGEAGHYTGTAIRIGSSTAVADASAIGHDGRTAAVARVSAYRHHPSN